MGSFWRYIDKILGQKWGKGKCLSEVQGETKGIVGDEFIYVMFVGVTFARALLKNKGVFYLTQAMDANKSATFTENALT